MKAKPLKAQCCPTCGRALPRTPALESSPLADEGPLLNVDEACALLRFVDPDGTPQRTRLYDFVKRRRPPHIKFRRNLLFRASDLLAFFRRVEPPTSLSAYLVPPAAKTGTR